MASRKIDKYRVEIWNDPENFWRRHFKGFQTKNLDFVMAIVRVQRILDQLNIELTKVREKGEHKLPLLVINVTNEKTGQPVLELVLREKEWTGLFPSYDDPNVYMKS